MSARLPVSTTSCHVRLPVTGLAGFSAAAEVGDEAEGGGEDGVDDGGGSAMVFRVLRPWGSFVICRLRSCCVTVLRIVIIHRF